MKREEFLKAVEDLGKDSAIIHIEVVQGGQDQVLSAGDLFRILYGTGLLIKSMHTVTKTPIDKLLGLVREVAEYDIQGRGAVRAYENKPPVKEFCKMMEQKLPEYLPKGLPALIRPGTEGGEDYLEVRAPGSDFSTKIWLAALYTMFQCGISENEILMRSADQAALVLRSKEDWILDWQQAKKKILPAAVAYRSDALQDVPHRRIEDIAVVTHAHKRSVEILKSLLKNILCLEVEVVGRLVENKQIHWL